MNVNEDFKFISGTKERIIIVEQEKMEKCIEYINQYNIKGVSIDSRYYSHANIRFLENCTNISEVLIFGSNVIDFSGLYGLKNLQKLVVNNPIKAELDISLLCSLNVLGVEWCKNIKGIEKCINLRRLKLRKYKDKSNNLAVIKDYNFLKLPIVVKYHPKALLRIYQN